MRIVHPEEARPRRAAFNHATPLCLYEITTPGDSPRDARMETHDFADIPSSSPRAYAKPRRPSSRPSGHGPGPPRAGHPCGACSGTSAANGVHLFVLETRCTISPSVDEMERVSKAGGRIAAHFHEPQMTQFWSDYHGNDRSPGNHSIHCTIRNMLQRRAPVLGAGDIAKSPSRLRPFTEQFRCHHKMVFTPENARDLRRAAIWANGVLWNWNCCFCQSLIRGQTAKTVAGKPRSSSAILVFRTWRSSHADRGAGDHFAFAAGQVGVLRMVCAGHHRASMPRTKTVVMSWTVPTAHTTANGISISRCSRAWLYGRVFPPPRMPCWRRANSTIVSATGSFTDYAAMQLSPCRRRSPQKHWRKYCRERQRRQDCGDSACLETRYSFNRFGNVAEAFSTCPMKVQRPHTDRRLRKQCVYCFQEPAPWDAGPARSRERWRHQPGIRGTNGNSRKLVRAGMISGVRAGPRSGKRHDGARQLEPRSAATPPPANDIVP